MDTGHRREALEVVLSWDGAPLNAESFDGPRSVLVGEADAASFMLPRDVIGADFELLSADGADWMLHVPAGATALMLKPGEPKATELAAGAPVRLVSGAVAEVKIGAFSLHVRPMPVPEKAAAALAIDWRAVRFIGGSCLVHAAILGVMTFAPPDASALSSNLSQNDAEYVRVQLTAIETLQREVETLRGSASQGGAEGRPMQGPEGQAGATEERRNTGGRVARRGNDRETQVPRTPQNVRDMPIFNSIALAAARLQTVSSAYGADTALASDPEDAYGQLAADRFGFGPGTDGWGMTDAGRGGCPPGATNCGQGTVGVGNDLIGTGSCSREHFRALEASIGHAAAVDRCRGPGNGPGGPGGPDTDLGPHRERVPTLRSGEVAVNDGGLSRETVRRVVQRNLSQVRFCYTQQLQTRPDLEGRVSVRFYITPTGTVGAAAVNGSSINSSQVEQCVASSVRRWTFPQATSPTLVTYPFLFTTTP